MEAVDIRDEFDSEVVGGVCFKSFIRHFRSQVRAADADVDDVADGLACEAAPFAGADAASENGHALKHGVDSGHHVLALD